MAERLAFMLAVCLLSPWKPCLAGDPAVEVFDGQRQQQQKQQQQHQQQKQQQHHQQQQQQRVGERACTLNELLPRSCNRKSLEWSDDYVVDPPYDCTCAAMKARYFCPSQRESGYPKWVPRAVTSGSCTSPAREKLDEAPLPPKFKVLFYGNSHLRQVVEAIMCMFQGALTSKRVTLGLEDVQTVVQSDIQCRACTDVNRPGEISDRQESLLNNGCIADYDICRCDDDQGEFFFENGATAHYTFANAQPNKGLADALHGHGNEDLSSYDAVFMNHGNLPAMSSDLAIATAIKVQGAGAQFFWLSTYEGGGGFNKWPESQRVRFIESGAKYFDVGCMMRGMQPWTRGRAEGGSDPHFCLPGPPNEVAVLMLQLMWAVHDRVRWPAMHEGKQ